MEDTTIVARHLNVTEAIKKYALQKAGKIKKIFEWILHIQVTLDTGGDNSHLVGMIVSIPRGAPLVAKSSDSDMCRAIDLAVDKIESQLKKHKRQNPIKDCLKEKADNNRNGRFSGYTRCLTGNNSIGGRLSYEIN
ncbi:MAG TPA: ribosome hibernation-promoting factor, HPF/YfiA family [Candidatus Brocadiaceae bacterium]